MVSQRGLFCGLLLIFELTCLSLEAQHLFDSDEILEFTLSGNLNELFKDKADKASYHPITLFCKDTNGNNLQLPIKSKTRGNFRRKLGDCKMPPLWLNFDVNSINSKESIFNGQDKIKLVTPCRADKYIVGEYLVYKLYNLITPESFKARLIKVSYFDSLKNKNLGTYYGILLENEEVMANRLNKKILEGKLIRPEATDREAFLKVAVFEYLIGNTDWSIQYQQNIKLLTQADQDKPSLVPYDFDQSGIVNAPYALPAEELKLGSVRERRYRGYCIKDITELTELFSFYNKNKDEIYKIFTECPYLENSYKNSTLSFLDSFYETINDPKRAKNEFTYPCRNDETTNVIIKGLN